MQIQTTAPPAPVSADRQRRTITGQVVPWGIFAHVSTGQKVGFARGSLSLSERAKLVLDHDPAQPVAVYVSSSDTADGLEATFRVPAGDRGDAILAEAAEGLRDGLSVAAELVDFDERDDGIWVTAARGRHVALLSEPAYDTARVSSVAATAPIPESELTMTMTEPEPVAAAEDDDAITLTVAGAAPALPPLDGAPARVRDPYPYAVPCELGGPSFVRDAWASMENPGGAEAERWRRAQAMANEPLMVRAGLARLSRAGADIQAATGTTTGEPALVPPRWLPERFVPLKAAKAPLYTVLTKYGTPDFNTLDVPRTATETGLSGTPTDEVTPIAPGDITTTNDTITIAEVEGAYSFSRKLLLGSNPQIDRIALDAMERAWLADVEARAVAFFSGAANSTAISATYADGPGAIAAIRGALANMAVTPYSPTDIIPASKEYVAMALANDTAGAPLFPMAPLFNRPGESTQGFAALAIQGVPLWPGPSMTANHVLILDQSIDSAAVFATPVLNFRLEWTTDATTGGNVKVLKLVKYSGVGFWSQYKGGVRLITNTTPLPFQAGEEEAPAADEEATTPKAKK
jgi:hypothetical protein